MFASIEADIILYGHDHQGSTVFGNEKMYINCGSLGCPSQGNGIANAVILVIDASYAAFETVQSNTITKKS
ncbi:MAG TPA: hypothetical protein DCY20_02590 [Firmicutes bacterium]|nr:hypothetical protein [Bacillota bacterium]